jgi:glycosyltransferase involved in cell wall biosynthesis
MPKVSVVTSFYNTGSTLRASVQSILAQTFSDFEFIIVNDGSNDESAAILGEIRDPRIVSTKNDHNLGLSSSLNRAILLAQGEYVARHDADDISLPDRLALQVAFLDQNSEIGVLGGQMEVFNEAGHGLETYSLPTSHGQIAWRLFFDRSFAHPSVMMRKQLLKHSGGYDERLRYSQDHELWTRLVRVSRFANLPDVLVRYQSQTDGPGFLKIEDQFMNRIHSRQKLASLLLKVEVPVSYIRWLDAAQKQPCTLSENQKRTVVDLVLQLFEAYKRNGVLRGEDEQDVYPDFIQRLLAVGDCGEKKVQSRTGSRLEGLTWGMRNPVVATRKLLGLNKTRPKPLSDFNNKAQKKQTANELTVIVLTHKREKGLEKLLESLTEQRFHSGFELIVFNNSPLNQFSFSHGLMAKFSGQFPDFKLINSNHNWGTVARYGMATMAGSETILMLDDDIFFRDPLFLSDMFETFRSLKHEDMLSCWNELWVDWDETTLKTVSLDFLTPGITEVITTDTLGPGIAMFNRQLILNPSVMDIAMQRNQQRPIVSDMGFPLASVMKHGGRCKYFPAWGRISFHDQAHEGAIYQIPGRHGELLRLYKHLYSSGYQPVISCLDKLSSPEAEKVHWAIETLPSKIYSW